MLRRGSKGTDVTNAQNLLLRKGYDLGRWGADGDFGSATEAAVIRFQRDSGLAPDGIIGPATWEALESEAPPAVLYTVTIPRLTKEQAEALVKQYPGAMMQEEGE